MKNFVKKTLLILSLNALLACASNVAAPPNSSVEQNQFSRSPTYYQNQQRQAPVRQTPDYYYAQPVYGTQNAPYQNGQQYQNRQYQNPYQSGGSRAYSNPYAFDPAPQYPYYEADQYYVAPKTYGSPETGFGGKSAIHNQNL